MRISLIGMSGAGKSHWAMKLAERGFRVFHCDDLIEEQLGDELRCPDGSILEVGEWMGFPYDPDYELREEKYLLLERAVLIDIFDGFRRRDVSIDEDVVIDTTGSVIYAGDHVLEELCRWTTVIHLETPRDVRQQMLDAYLLNRRPVVWRNHFDRRPDETCDAALARCYPRLISDREASYRRYAHVTVPYADHSDPASDVDDILAQMNRYPRPKGCHP